MPASAGGGVRRRPTPPSAAVRHGRAGVGLWLTLPALLALGVTVIYPVAWTLWLSLNGPDTALRGTPDFRGLDNYIRIGGSGEFQAALVNTLGLTRRASSSRPRSASRWRSRSIAASGAAGSSAPSSRCR